MDSKLYTATLSDEQIILFTEISLINLMNLCKGAILSKSAPDLFLNTAISTALIEALRSLLREPLRNRQFRSEFNEYFNRHPDEGIRTIGWERLRELLVWES
jgi:hypothetical protein